MRSFLLLLLAAALPASAGVVYDFTTTFENARLSESVTGRVWAEGEAYRAEMQRGGRTHIVISRDGDRTVTYVDPAKQTWSNRARAFGSDVRSSSLFSFPVSGARLHGTPQIAHRRDAETDEAGLKAVPHTIDVRFNVRSDMDVKGSYHVTARIWVVESLPPLPMKSELRTGYPVVDGRLVLVTRGIKGMVVRHELEVTRTLDGGPPQTERTVTRVTQLAQQPVEATVFDVPDTFTYAGPMTAK
ncbi:MAG TPA: hypothetical protein VEK11_24270 [Thermoanaerobaculia bacterium]|nr:hypothetical protein [Thermoanaerobaculia bacterium]